MASPTPSPAIAHEALLRVPAAITITDADAIVLYASRVEPGIAPGSVIGTRYGEGLPPEERPRLEAVLARVRATGQPESFERCVELRSGEHRWCSNQWSWYETRGGATGFVCVLTDVTDRKAAELRAESLHHQTIEASHRAGMAEIATGVLHNVGNVLNSVNVGADVLAHALDVSRLHLLRRAVAMVREHEDRLAWFLAHDPRGQRLPALLGRLVQELDGEQRRLLDELARLRRHVGLMRSIVEAQQRLAKLGDMIGPTRPDELVHETLSLFQLGLESRRIELSLELGDVGTVLLDKQATLQILANLVRNAIEALETVEPPRRLAIRLHADDRQLHFDVTDDGCGITPEDLARLFQHGFSTKPSGHGFGLHASTIAARTMDGVLEAHSEGRGRGARFRLTLPRIVPP